MPKPLIKWIGGKSKLLKELSLYVPNNCDNYIEPFVGSGALAFRLAPHNGLISDANAELINFYRQIRDNPLEVLQLSKGYELTEESYYAVRNSDRAIGWKDNTSCLSRAARFLFLNRTCFNGMWRVNGSGLMNTPYGRYEKIIFPTKDHVLDISKVLKNIDILNVDFYDTLRYVNNNSFVYLDPPGIPYSDTAKFTSYSAKGFTIEDQYRLRDYCKEVNAIGGKFLLSNSDTALTREIYADFDIISLVVYHCVGASLKSRRNKGEVFVRNYAGNCNGLFL